LGGPGLPPHFRRDRSPQRSLMLARARSIFHWPSRARMSIMGRQISAPEHRPRAGLPPCSRREPSSEGSRRLAKARSYFSMAFTSKFSDPVQSDPPRIRPLRSITARHAWQPEGDRRCAAPDRRSASSPVEPRACTAGSSSSLTGEDPSRCPVCAQGRLRRERELARDRSGRVAARAPP